MARYRVGSVVRYLTFCCDLGGPGRTVTVTSKEADVKNGRPGFSGTNEHGNYWGYDSQIVEVVSY